jgi:FtsP/CotA-like multicopper oxidase with cupredoxin domain
MGALQSPAANIPGQFHQMTTYRSQNGQLSLDLKAEKKQIELDGTQVEALTFNGEYAGPILRLKQGDVLHVNLTNATDEITNFHFHGYHGSPLANGDNMHIEIQPGTTFAYSMTIPESQPPGLYWYHTHIHHQAEDQVNRGLSGAIIVEGIDSRIPETKGLQERLLVLKTFTLPEGSETSENKRLHGLVQTINGHAHNAIQVVSGSTELWRLSNQSPNDYLHLYIKGVKFKVIALDGSPLLKDEITDRLEIGPAARVEVLVTFPKEGNLSLMSGSVLTGVGKAMKRERELAAITVISNPTDLSTAQSSAPRSPHTPDLRLATITAKRTVHFSQKPGEEVYFVDGKTFDHTRIDTRVPLGSIEEWTIENETEDMHIFHIHQVHFQVVAINGEPQEFNEMHDTMRVPEKGNITIRIPFTDPKIVGSFMYHCHVLKHEDHGMMAMIEVYDPSAPTTESSDQSGHNHGEMHEHHGAQR